MKKIWIDTDPGVDDAVAIAMLLEAKDKIQFVGASTVFGNVDVDQTTRNARLLFQAGGLGDLPIARGASGPLGILRETAPYVHGDNGLGNMELAEPTMPVNALTAPQAIINMILKHPHEITLFPIGPLTNIAMAYLLEPTITALVKEVVIMGGAVFSPGNITPAAEANFYHDPHAAQIVIRAGWPIVLAGLDVMQYGVVPQETLNRICAAKKPLTPYIAGALPFFKKFSELVDGEGMVFFPDTLAAGYLLAPEIYTLEETRLYVETAGACKGQSLPVNRQRWFEIKGDDRVFDADSNLGLVNVMTKVDKGKFLALMEKLLT